MRDLADGEILELALEEFGCEDIEIDTDVPCISRGDGGAWVRAWVYVLYPGGDEGEEG